jgi:H+/Cl- antiporter ClcA
MVAEDLKKNMIMTGAAAGLAAAFNIHWEELYLL